MVIHSHRRLLSSNDARLQKASINITGYICALAVHDCWGVQHGISAVAVYDKPDCLQAGELTHTGVHWYLEIHPLGCACTASEVCCAQPGTAQAKPQANSAGHQNPAPCKVGHTHCCTAFNCWLWLFVCHDCKTTGTDSKATAWTWTVCDRLLLACNYCCEKLLAPVPGLLHTVGKKHQAAHHVLLHAMQTITPVLLQLSFIQVIGLLKSDICLDCKLMFFVQVIHQSCTAGVVLCDC